METVTTNDIPATNVPYTTGTKMDINEAHDKFGHIGEAALRSTLKMVNIEPTGTMRICGGCEMSKAKSKAVPKVGVHKATIAGERLCTDISGPYKKSIIGSTYWVLVVDEFSGKSWSYFVKKKSQISTSLNDLLSKLQYAKIKTSYLRCDNAGENTKGLVDVCIKYNVHIEFTAPYTPKQNGIVERKFVTIRDRSVAAMIKAKFSDESQGLLWAESVNTHTRLSNIVCNSNDNENCPDYLFYGTKPTLYKNLIQFGRIGWMKFGIKPMKLSPKATKVVMIGYSPDHAGDTYWVYNPDTKKVINSRNIRWAEWHADMGHEQDMPLFMPTMTTPTLDAPPAEPVIPDPMPHLPATPVFNATKKTVRFGMPEMGGNMINSDESIISRSSKLNRELKKLATDGGNWTKVQGQGARRSLKLQEDVKEATLDELPISTTNDTTQDQDLNNAPETLQYVYSAILESDALEPKNYRLAMAGSDKDEWIKAIKNEIDNFYKRKVWVKVPRSVLFGRKPLGTRWVFKKKTEPDLSIRYKGRIVVKGYVQIPGVDFTDSYAPVATDSATRLLFAMTLSKKDWVCEIVDVEAAFLEGDLEEKIYIEWPDGIEEFKYENKKTIETSCILLDKAMYGTVQAALQFFKKLVQIMTIVGLTQSQVDPCIFYLKKNDILVLIVATHVDDCAIGGTPADIQWFKDAIRKHFNIKELGVLKKHLGVWYEWGNDSTGRYLESNMDDFVMGMANDYKTTFGQFPKAATSPALPGTNLRKNEGTPLSHKEFRSIVGKLLYFVKKIGPVCANACRELSQHLENPGELHWKAVERLLGYICATKENRRLKLRAPNEFRVMDVVDSSYADNPDTRKSTSAYLGTIGGNALVHWISKGQPIVTMSSTEAEYVALSDGSKETTFMTNLLGELGHSVLPILFQRTILVPFF